MAPDDCTFEVIGAIPVGGGRGRWGWRLRVRDAILSLGAGPMQAGPDDRFRVDVEFRLVRFRASGADLDNLVKPVLDTVFRSLDAQAEPELTGVLVPDVSDASVFELTARKRVVDSAEAEGVRVHVTRLRPVDG